MELWIQYVFAVCVIVSTLATVAEKVASIFQIQGTKPYANMSASAAAAIAAWMREFNKGGEGKPDARPGTGTHGAGKDKPSSGTDKKV